MLARDVTGREATDIIRSLNRHSVPYDFFDSDGEVVGEVEGLWQSIKDDWTKVESSDVERPGAERHVFKTDPTSVVQPSVGWRMIADGETWQIAEKGFRSGMFLVWPLFKVR